MTDPFATLRLFDDFDAASISAAFAEALRRGEPMADARSAMDILRDPGARAAMALLSPSMSQAARRERERGLGLEEDAALETLLRVLHVAVEQLDGQLASSAHAPRRVFEPDKFLPPLPDHLQP